MPKQSFDFEYLKGIVEVFLTQPFDSVSPFGKGSINDTFKVVAGGRPYFLQRINHEYFPRPEKLRENFTAISACLGPRLSLRPVPALNGELWFLSREGSYWRMFHFIEQSYSCTRIDNIYQAYEIAKAFGTYIRLLSDLPSGSLHQVVPGFHDTPSRLQMLTEAISADEFHKLENCRAEIALIDNCREEIEQFSALLSGGSIPERFAHNDTGIDNALLDLKTNAAVAVIDLDTTMAGNSLFDFGDMFRSSLGVEFDERPSPVECFRSLLKGYLAGSGNLLTEGEIVNFPLSGRIISLELGIRYLTDYLSGDKVFHYDNGASLLRARKSLIRYMIMKLHAGQFEEIVGNALDDYAR